MDMTGSGNQVGKTRDAGWQIGLRRTLSCPADQIWDWMLSSSGVEHWLGSGAQLKWKKGMNFKLKDGTTGELRVYKPGSHFRITRHPADYPRPSTIQVRVVQRGEKTLLAFHEEHLPDENERRRRKTHYLRVLEKIKSDLGNCR
jgi:activator of HSP90 ATPase